MKQERNQQRYGAFLGKLLLEIETKRLACLKAERKRLICLQKELLALGDFPSETKRGIEYNIHFFDITCRFQDEGYLEYQPSEKAKTLELFNLTIEECGRQKNWNISKKGEKITKDNILYGGIDKLPLKSARFWLSLPKNHKSTISFHSILAMDIKNSPFVAQKYVWITEALVEAQIKGFTKNKLKVILNCIQELLN